MVHVLLLYPYLEMCLMRLKCYEIFKMIQPFILLCRDFHIIIFAFLHYVVLIF